MILAIFPPVAAGGSIRRLAGGDGKPRAGRCRHITGALVAGSRRRDRGAGPPERASGDAVMSRRLTIAIVIGLAVAAASISLLRFRPRTILSKSGPDAVHLQAEADEVRSGKSIFVDARNHPDIRDKDLEVLLGLTNLRIVNLDTSPITDEGLKVIARVPSIDTVSVSRTEITDAGLAELGTLTDMNELRLDATAITDAGLAHFKAFPRLRVLSLYQTGITDAGMVHLKHLTMLQRLSLDETLVSDAGLKELSVLSNLRELFVWRTQVTDAGINDLKSKLPKLKINRGSD
jgi:hypothetical protein